MRTSTCLLPATVALLAASSGCGLVSVPFFQTLPSPPLRRVAVYDFDSREPLPDAEVSFTITKWENWLEPMPGWGVSNTADDPSPPVDIDESHESWDAEAAQPGVFEFDTRTRVGWATIWAPLPSVLGPFRYDMHDGHARISAPGYKTIWVDDATRAKHIPDWRQDEESPQEGLIEFRQGALHVLLPKQTVRKDPTTNP